MGRTRTPQIDGIEIRTYASGRQVFRIHFQYLGVECRETLKGIKVNKAGEKTARAMLGTIQREITLNQFDYLKWFPQSRKGKLLSRGSAYLTLDAIADDYRAHMTALVGIRYQPASVKAYIQGFDAFVLPRFGSVAVSDLTAPSISRALTNLAKDGKTPKTISAYKTALNKALDYCVEMEYLDSNPAHLVKAGAAAAKKREEKIDPLSQDEVDLVLDSARNFDPVFARYLTFALYSGLRTSELYGLQWGDVDWNRQSVTVQRAVVHGKMKVPKTASGVREVLLRGLAWAALQGQRAETELRGEFVFLNPLTGNPYKRYKETGGRWKRIMKRAGVRYRNQYQTRHTYASNLLSQGENEFFVAKQLGHANVNQVRNTYGRWIEQASKTGPHTWVSDYGEGKVKTEVR